MFCKLCDKRLNKKLTIWTCRFCERGGLCGSCMSTHRCDREISGMLRRLV